MFTYENTVCFITYLSCYNICKELMFYKEDGVNSHFPFCSPTHKQLVCYFFHHHFTRKLSSL